MISYGDDRTHDILIYLILQSFILTLWSTQGATRFTNCCMVSLSQKSMLCKPSFKPILTSLAFLPPQPHQAVIHPQHPPLLSSAPVLSWGWPGSWGPVLYHSSLSPEQPPHPRARAAARGLQTWGASAALQTGETGDGAASLKQQATAAVRWCEWQVQTAELALIECVL